MSNAASTQPNAICEYLNELLAEIRTSTREYVSVIDAFPNRQGRNLVRLFVKERNPVANQLRHTIRHLGGDPTEANLSPSKGELRALWDSLFLKEQSNPEIELLYHCESMDARLVTEYDEILEQENHHLPFAYVEILRDQRNILAMEVESLGAYRHSLENSASEPICSISSEPQSDQPMLVRPA